MASRHKQGLLGLFELARTPFTEDHVARLRSRRLTLRLPSLAAPALDAFLTAHPTKE
jgi:hypothetical protein